MMKTMHMTTNITVEYLWASRQKGISVIQGAILAGVATFMFFNRETNIGRILVINTRISSQEGAKQFYAIWNTLEKSETLFQSH